MRACVRACYPLVNTQTLLSGTVSRKLIAAERWMSALSTLISLTLSLHPPKVFFSTQSGLSTPSTINYSPLQIFVFLSSSSLSFIIFLPFFSADWRLQRTELACSILPGLCIRQWIVCMCVCLRSCKGERLIKAASMLITGMALRVLVRANIKVCTSARPASPHVTPQYCTVT